MLNKINLLASSLLKTWCEKLLSLIDSDGRLICPACMINHGRTFDLIYPFMYEYSVTKNKDYLDKVIALFNRAENDVSQNDGSYLNDTDSEWKGTTVFSAIQLLDSIIEFGDLFPEDILIKIKDRIFKAVSFLKNWDELKKRNINYPISCSLAMYLAYKVYKDDSFLLASDDFFSVCKDSISINGLIIGEGKTRNMVTSKHCYPIDIGYNVEESIPAIIRLGVERNDEKIINLGAKLLKSHSMFFLSDGGLDNSFGSRSYKWTYYGSRTTDGVLVSLLLLKNYDNSYISYAYEKLKLLEKCTYEGILAGGLGYKSAKEKTCVHHTFTNAKTLAYILNHNLAQDVVINSPTLPRYQIEGCKYFSEIDSAIISSYDLTATITGYDWPSIKEAHPSGGTLSLLHHRKIGPIISSSMNKYIRFEKNNMQECKNNNCECTSPRLVRGSFSSIYDYTCSLKINGLNVYSEGKLTNEIGEKINNYSLNYKLNQNSLLIQVLCKDSNYILPIVIFDSDVILINDNNITIVRESKYSITISIKKPYNTKKIFNLVPGFICLEISKYVNQKINVEIKMEEV